MKPAPFAYARPKDWPDALRLLAAGARPGAGTQSLGPLLNLRLAQPDTIADLRHLPDYAGVLAGVGVLRIGAGTTHAAIEDGAVPGRVRVIPSCFDNVAGRLDPEPPHPSVEICAIRRQPAGRLGDVAARRR